jgi:hypothetical protein
VGSYLARFLGVMEAMSVLGVLILAGLIWWLWRQYLPSDRRRLPEGASSPLPEGPTETKP